MTITTPMINKSFFITLSFRFYKPGGSKGEVAVFINGFYPTIRLLPKTSPSIPVSYHSSPLRSS